MTNTDQDAKKKANAERQKEYRKRHKENKGQRLDIRISGETDHALELLSLHCNKTKKEVVETLINEALMKLSDDPNVNMNDVYDKLYKSSINNP